MGDQVRSVRVRLSAENASYIASMRAAGTETKRTSRDMDDLSTSARKVDSDLDRVSGRAKILAQVLAIVGPAAIPISAIAIPALSGLASQLGFTAAGAGTMVLAFQGVGDALKAVNKARLEPTTDNLIAARVAMDRLSPSAQRLVKQIQDLAPKGQKLVGIAAEGFFPGLSEGIESLETLYPRAKKIIRSISGELGDIAAETGGSLASDRWAPFLDFVGDQAPQNLDVMAESLGNVAHGLAGLWMGTQPLNDDFNSWLLSTTSNFDRFSNTLDKNRAFQDLMSYIDDTGPQAGATATAFADALVQIVQAAAPLGGPVLAGLEATANVIGDIADSDLGTPIFTSIAALSLLNRGLAVTAAMQTRTFGGPAVARVRILGSTIRSLGTDLAVVDRAGMSLSRSGRGFIGPLTQAQTSLQRIKGTASGLGRTTAAIGALTAVSTGAADGLGLANSASLALVGTAIAPGLGTAIGGFSGLLLDAASASNQVADGVNRANDAIAHSDLNKLNIEIDSLRGNLDDLEHSDGIVDTFSDTWNDLWGGDWLNKAKAIPVVGTYISAAFGDGESAADRYKAALDDANRAREELLNPPVGGIGTVLLGPLGGQFKTLGSDIDGANSALMDFLGNYDKFSGKLSQDQSVLNYRQSLRDLRKTLKDNPLGNTLTQTGNPNSAAVTQGDSVRAGIIKAAADARDMLKGLQGLDFVTTSRKAVKDIRAIGDAFNIPKAQLDQLLISYGLLDKQPPAVPKIKPKIDGKQAKSDAQKLADVMHNILFGAPPIPVKADTSMAQSQVQGFINGWAGHWLSIPIRTTGSAKNKDGTPNRDGNPKTGDGLAGGGSIYGPGTKTSDSVPIMASVGEFMQPADSVDYYGVDFMEAVRRRQLPKFAGGGPIGSRPGNGLREYIRGDLDLKFPKTLKQWEKALESSKDAIDKERDQRNDLISQRDDKANSIAEGLRQDPFAERPDNWEWMAAADRQRFLTQNPVDILNSNATKGDAFTKALQALTAKGLKGAGFDQLASTSDLERVQAFAGLTPAQLATYANAVKRSDAATLRAGTYGAGVLFNPQISQSNAHLAVMVAGQKGIRDELHDIRVEIKKHGAKGKASSSGAGASTRTRKRT